MNEVLSLHKQYQRQAAWTKALRLFLYRRVHLARKQSLLELGSGSGVILGEISERTDARICGIESGLRAAAFAKRQNQKNKIENARAEELPFKDNSFDLIVTHYFWLWAGNPKKVLSECRRVLKKGGHLASLCEPDYVGRRDEPSDLAVIGDMMVGALVKQGADPGISGKLATLMAKAGFSTEDGRQENCWGWREYQKEFEAEWKFIRHLCGPGKELRSLRRKDRQAVAERTRKLLMPVCWAVGTKL